MSVALGRSHGGRQALSQGYRRKGQKVLDRIRIDHACQLFKRHRFVNCFHRLPLWLHDSTPFGVCFRRLRDCTPGECRSSRLASRALT